jgi:mannose-6-phosphate isomerase-like protein (cupin superfamily)
METGNEPDTPKGHRVRPDQMAIFLARNATDLTESTMPCEGRTAADVAGVAKAQERDLNIGHFIKVLFSDDARGVSLTYVWFKSNYMLVRHSHDADCVYYVVSGELVLGDETMGPGDGFMVPANAKYSYRAGPGGVEVLEFRTATKFNIVLSNTETAWSKMLDVRAANREAWASEAPPAAAARMGARTQE